MPKWQALAILGLWLLEHGLATDIANDASAASSSATIADPARRNRDLHWRCPGKNSAKYGARRLRRRRRNNGCIVALRLVLRPGDHYRGTLVRWPCVIPLSQPVGGKRYLFVHFPARMP